MQCLANVDAVLCARVAQGLGLSAPEPTIEVGDPQPSPALSQLGQTWPVTGRIIGIIADETSDLDAVRAVRDAVDAAGMVPLIIAPNGGMLGAGSSDPMPVQRTFLTARSVEYDAILVSASPAPAPDAEVPMDAKAGFAAPGEVDPRVAMLIAETFRHSKAIGGWAGSEVALAAAGCESGVGVVLDDSPLSVLQSVTDLLALHRVWDRFPPASV